MPQIPFVGASYTERSGNLDCQVCINLFPVLGESGTAKAVRALYGTPGTRPLVTIADGTVRGMHPPTTGEDAIVVIGATVYRLSRLFVLTSIGSVDDLDTPVKIDDNGLQAVIVTGPNGYVVDLAKNTVTQINDPAFYGADTVDFLNTYAIFNKPGTNIFYISGSNEITFDALDFATAESNYEPIVNFIVNHEEIIFFKLTTTEIWRKSSGDFAFSRDTNASIEQGCEARDSVASMDSTVFWLGQNADGGGIVYRMNGYSPVRISTDAVEFAIAQYSTRVDAVAYAYQQEGHTFYVLSFPTGNATWVYDAATQLWHERAYRNPTTGRLGRHRSNSHMFFAGKHIVGDFQNGNLYSLDLDYFFDGASDPLPAIRTASHVATPDYGWIIHNRLEIEVEPGVGLNDGQGSAPVAMLDWSNDGGKTWSSQHESNIGRMGDYGQRLFWTRLGRARNRVYRLMITDPIKRVILGAALNPRQS